MPTFAWILALLIMLVGWFGSLVPLFPGTPIILCGAVLHRILLGPEHSVGWLTLVVLTVLVVVACALDFLSGSLGAKYFGATRWGAIGGILGGIVGLFFGIPGVFLGPLLGALLGELLGGRDILPAGKSGWGTLLGTTAGIVGKFIIGGVMVAWFVVAAIW